MLAHTPVEFNYLETNRKTFTIYTRQHQFIPENIFNIAPVCRIAIAKCTDSAFTASYTENPFWYQQNQHLDLKRNAILRGGQPNMDFDAADNFRLYVTAMKAMNSQNDIPSILIVFFPKTNKH